MKILLMEDDPVLGEIVADYLKQFYAVDRVSFLVPIVPDGNAYPNRKQPTNSNTPSPPYVPKPKLITFFILATARISKICLDYE